MNVLIVDNAPETDEFSGPVVDVLEKHSISSLVAGFDEPDLEEKVNKSDAIIITASPMGDDIVDDCVTRFSWLETTPSPILGICAGHQIMGCFFGGELLRSTYSESGVLPVKQLKADPIFKDMQEEFDAFHAHNDSVACLPGFEVIASSEECPNQVMKHKERSAYSTQFHAERLATELIDNFICLASPEL